MRAKDSKKSTISLLIIIAVVIAAMFIINVICNIIRLIIIQYKEIILRKVSYEKISL